MSAIEVFKSHELGVLNLVKAADLFTIHVVARMRNQLPSQEVIDLVLKEPRASGFIVGGGAYSSNELTQLEREGRLQQIGEQIVLLAYTALEIYLVEKFKEYFKHLLRETSERIVVEIIKRYSFRSIDEIKGHYFEILKMHLPSFDVEFFSDDQSHFQSDDSWSAILLLSRARNEIAHTGTSESYRVVTPLDAWYPFEFSRRWVSLFDANFDAHFYRGQDTPLYRKYKQRMDRALAEGRGAPRIFTG